MYRPTMYGKHDESMNRFAELFHACPVCSNLRMYPNPQETYDNDGIFMDTGTNQSIGYDWEYRDRYFSNCVFQFPTLGQYERKLRKPSIQIAIQCDSTETGIAVGWHADWLEEERQNLLLRTDFVKKEQGVTRYTTRFRVYSYENMGEFKEMLQRAFEQENYSAQVF